MKAVRPLICSLLLLSTHTASDLVNAWQAGLPNIGSVTGILKHLRTFRGVSEGFSSPSRNALSQQSSSEKFVFDIDDMKLQTLFWCQGDVVVQELRKLHGHQGEALAGQGGVAWQDRLVESRADIPGTWEGGRVETSSRLCSPSG